jgi:hypothetical protein
LAATTEKASLWNTKKPPEFARRLTCGRGGQVKDLPTPPTGEQKQKQRTFDVLLKPANLISYRQPTPSPLDAERARLRKEGFTDHTISQILLAREFAAPQATGGASQGVMTGVLSRGEVEKAMGDGCNVPERVLEEFPDLKDGN